MSTTGDISGRFGYAAYVYTTNFTHREWAWEFLRENPGFVADWQSESNGFAVGQVSDLRRTILERDAAPGLTRWGVKYSSMPTLDAGTASVFWSPEIAADVLRMYALCRCKDLDTPLFHIDEVACSVTLLIGMDGVQHLLFQEGGHSLQVRVAGDAVEQPVYLYAEAALDPRRTPAHLRALRCFNDLRRTGHLLERHFPPEPQGVRLDEVRHAFALARTITPHRDIAVGLYGEARVEADWTDAQSGMPDHVRRTLKRGRELVQSGYRNLLT